MPYKLKEGTKNEYDMLKDEKGNTLHCININQSTTDPIVRFKVTWDCTSYCLQKAFGPGTALMLNCEQWKDNRMVCQAKQKIELV